MSAEMSLMCVSFSKTLVMSNINQSYLGIPMKFREAHLPCQDDTVILVGESEQEYYVTYSAKNNRLAHGWRDFVIEHDLLEGDKLVFNLIGECKFKVVINRESRLRENELSNNMPVGFVNYKEDLIEEIPETITEVMSCRKPSLELYHPATYHVGPKGKIRKMNTMVKLQCGNILRELMSHSNGWVFNQPVDPVKLNLPDYFSVIKEPMDLGTIKRKLDGNRYCNMEEFAADVRLTFSNAILYNPPDHEVYEWAELFNDHFNIKWKLLESKLKHQGPTTASDDGQDSRQSVRKSCKDNNNNKEWEIVVHKGTGKVHPVKMVENRNKYVANNAQKAKCPLCSGLICRCRGKDTPDQAFSSDLSSGRSSEHNICGDSKMVDRLSQTRKRVREVMVSKERKKQVCTRRTQRSTETHGAYGNSNLDTDDSPKDTVHTAFVKEEIHEILDVHQDTNSVRMSLSNQFDRHVYNLSESVLNFEDVNEVKDFKIHLNGKNLTSEIPFQIQRKYYELCCTQKEFLHAHLSKGLNSKLVVEMITDIVSIVDATRAATLSTSLNYLDQMDKTLKFFEGCGMTVGFLRARLHSLVKRSREYLTVSELKRTKLSELEDEKTTMQEEISKTDDLMGSITARGASIGSLEAEIGVLEEKTQELGKIFKKVVDSPFVCLV